MLLGTINPHFSQDFYCGDLNEGVCCVRVAFTRTLTSDSSTYQKYASGVLGRKPCIHIRLDLLATNPCEKCGLRQFLHIIKTPPRKKLTKETEDPNELEQS
jgi:hypothetical protein